MSDTIVDMPKVCQMLDAGWHVRVYKGPMGSYEVRAKHKDDGKRLFAVGQIWAKYTVKGESSGDCEDAHCDGKELMADDFTPEQALTRMAYKVFGEIL